MFEENELRGIIEPELDKGETILWVGRPDPIRSLLPSLFFVFFGIFWIAFMVNFIYMWHSGMKDVKGPGGLFGMQGILSNLFFIPFLAIGAWALLSPIRFYRDAKHTVYGITGNRILVVKSGWSRKVQNYRPDEINHIERTERANGSGNLKFAKQILKDSDGDPRTSYAQFVGIPDVRTVEKLVRDLFENKVVES